MPSCCARCPCAIPLSSSRIYTTSDIPESTFSVPDLRDLQRQAPAFSGIAGHSLMFANVSRDGASQLLLGEVVTANYFDVLGVRPALGRGFDSSEDQVEGGKPHRRHRRRPLAAAIRVRPVDPRPTAADQGRGLHDCRRDARFVHRHDARVDGGAVGAGVDGGGRRAGRHERRRPVADRSDAVHATRIAMALRHRPARAHGHARAGTRQRRDRDERAAARVSRDEP